MYINSNSIDIFPVSKPRSSRGDGSHRSGRLFYEENITNLVRQITDMDSFIISAPSTFTTSLGSDLIFNIYGYYVKIKGGTSLSQLSGSNAKTYIIATIELEDIEGCPMEIKGQDDGGTYKGLSIVTVDTLPTDSATKKNLLLYTRSGSTWKISQDSYIKFTNQSINITGIDGCYK